MNDWEIIRLKDDRSAADCERWTIVYRVPEEYAPGGVFSLSVPKSNLNLQAALYEYDIDDHDDVNHMFDQLVTRPMLTVPPVGSPAPDGLNALLEAETPQAQMVRKTRNAYRGVDIIGRDPAELRADLMQGISVMKGGVARLKPAVEVELHAPGEPVRLADTSENPKYLLLADMVSRLRPDRIVEGRKYFREQRKVRRTRGVV